MIFSTEERARLYAWLMVELERLPSCELDPAPLATYVIALLKQDLPPQDLLSHLRQELQAPLKDEEEGCECGACTQLEKTC